MTRMGLRDKEATRGERREIQRDTWRWERMVRWRVRGYCVCLVGKERWKGRRIGKDDCNFRYTRVATVVRVKANYTWWNEKVTHIWVRMNSAIQDNVHTHTTPSLHSLTFFFLQKKKTYFILSIHILSSIINNNVTHIPFWILIFLHFYL